MSEPVTAITKLEPAAHTPGPWRFTEEYGAAPDEPLRFCHCLIRNEGDAWIASTWSGNEHALADAALISQAPTLLAHAEKSLRWLLGERDCYYEGCANVGSGDVSDADDRAVLDSLDRDIDELRALIAAAKGEA